MTATLDPLATLYRRVHARVVSGAVDPHRDRLLIDEWEVAERASRDDSASIPLVNFRATNRLTGRENR